MGSGNAVQFARTLKTFSDDIRKRSDDLIVEDVYKVAAAALIQTSPVDTGHFSSNWDVVDPSEDPTVGEFGTYAELKKRQREGDLGAPNEVRAKAADRANRKLLGKRLGDPVSIANGTEYGIYLEEGSSRQAPAGVLRHAIAAVRARLRR